ncbi:MAG: phytanoyl-CoA dioxygenase [Gammaproteobacteria bacterium]|nr:MAG: phytanoyl-CoA dioxygenase [Gammaproteobacteria bacterium]
MARSTALSIDPVLVTRYREDGVVHLPGVLSPQTLERAQEAYHWSLANPGPGAARLPDRNPGTFYQDLANPAALTRYAALTRACELPDLVAALWGESQVWFMYEQVFAKSGAATRRTPWHQDAPYLPVRGDHLSVAWLSFEPVAAPEALEFIRGSHRGPIYDGSRFDPDDDAAPLYGDGSLPPLPDIEAQRERWPIVSWATEPGDVVMFHPAALHGGAATSENRSRHTLSLRFFGPDAVVAARPGSQSAERAASSGGADAHPLTRMRALADGTPFRDDAFPRLRP